MIRARISEGLLAALGTLAAAWPLTTLLVGQGWLGQLVLLVLLVMVVGMLARATGTAWGVIVFTQLTALVLTLLALDLELHLGIQSLAMQVADLIQDANQTIATHAAPAPVTPGVEFVVSLVVPLLAIAVDLLAVTARRPAAAGIPLLGVFMLSASNATPALNPVYFVVVAIVWLSMVAHGGSRQMRRWASVFARPSTPARSQGRFDLSRHAALARWLGASGLALALLVPAVLPHSSPHFLTEGLGRGSGPGGSGSSSRSMFASEQAISADLKNQGTAPVLSFRTSDPAPPPLQVLVTSQYLNGRWNLRPSAPDLLRGDTGKRIPVGGISTAAPSATYTMHVQHNEIGAPQLAAPFPTRTADLGSVPWRVNPVTGRILPSRTPSSYTVTYQALDDDDRPATGGSAPSGSADLALPSAARPRLEALAAALHRSTPFDSAIAIQDYLRGGSFTYSLKLAARRIGPDGRLLDPLSNFLVTKRGYCIQFATAMVMLARAEGVPARMAVGFLPGTQDDSGVYQVVRSDAHAWPQLWFPGMGWTRFEPTPGSRSGAPPLYTIGSEPGTLTAPSGTATAPDLLAHNRPRPLPGAAAVSTSGGQDRGGLAAPLLALLLLAIIAALLLVVPLAALWRRRVLASGRGIEAQWTVLQSRLEDLGIDAPAGQSPRAAEEHYRKRADLGTGDTDPLHLAVQTLERARYAAPSLQPTTMTAQSAQILRQVRTHSRLRRRVRARLLPATGLHALACVVRWITRWPHELLARRERSHDRRADRTQSR